MNKRVNIWIAFSKQALDAFKERRTNEQERNPYSGPMDDNTYKIMSKIAYQGDPEVLSKTPSMGGKVRVLVSIDIVGNLAKAKAAIDTLVEKWPNHIIVVGAWWWDTGEQVKQDGSIAYPIPNQAWRLMPDIRVFDNAAVDLINPASPAVVELPSIPATSNADLRDLDISWGQAPRKFT